MISLSQKDWSCTLNASAPNASLPSLNTSYKHRSLLQAQASRRALMTRSYHHDSRHSRAPQKDQQQTL
jgi:hypothetical protein